MIMHVNRTVEWEDMEKQQLDFALPVHQHAPAALLQLTA